MLGVNDDSNSNSSDTSGIDTERSDVRASPDDANRQRSDQTQESSQPSLSMAALEALAVLGAQISLLTALLFFFGWTRNRATAEYLDFPESVLNTSLSSYLVSSVPALFVPALFCVLCIIALKVLDPYLREAISGSEHELARKWCCGALVTSPVVLPVSFLWIKLVPSLEDWWALALPTSLTLATSLAWYGVKVWDNSAPQPQTTPASAEESSNSRHFLADRKISSDLAMLTFILILLFWAVGAFAKIQGYGTAGQFTKNLQDQTQVVLFSRQDLRLDASQLALTVTPLGNAGKYRYRYQGFRLFSFSEGKLLLMPSNWTYEYPRVVVLVVDEDIRVEYGHW